MTVAELITALKKMPTHLDVYTAAHDNDEWEIQSETHAVYYCKKANFDPADIALQSDRERFEDCPAEWVIIRG